MQTSTKTLSIKLYFIARYIFFIAETEGLFKQIERYVFPCLLLVEKINLFPSSSQATTILFAFVFIDILSEADNPIFYRTDLFYIFLKILDHPCIIQHSDYPSCRTIPDIFYNNCLINHSYLLCTPV